MRRTLVIIVSLFALFAVAPAVGGAAAAAVIEVAGPYGPGSADGAALVTELELVAPAGSTIATAEGYSCGIGNPAKRSVNTRSKVRFRVWSSCRTENSTSSSLTSWVTTPES